jgi:hypothetical protein
LTGLDLLLDLCSRGVRFAIVDRAVRATPGNAVTARERVLLSAIKSEIRTLLLTELPDDPAESACDELIAAVGVAVCRRCARGIAAHVWKRASQRTNRCDFAIGGAGEPCQRCGEPVVEHHRANT